MRKLGLIFLIAVLMQGTISTAASPEQSLLVGRWSVDISRLPVPAEARPRSVTITFSNLSANALTTGVEIVDAAGTTISSEGPNTLDGKASPVTGSPEADLAAMKMPEPNVLVMALSKNRIPSSTRVYAVSVDGKSMVETAVYFSRDGVPILRTNYFRRIR